MLDIKLVPAVEILNSGEPADKDIKLETPINLFPSEQGTMNVAEPAKPRPQPQVQAVKEPSKIIEQPTQMSASKEEIEIQTVTEHHKNEIEVKPESAVPKIELESVEKTTAVKMPSPVAKLEVEPPPPLPPLPKYEPPAVEEKISAQVKSSDMTSFMVEIPNDEQVSADVIITQPTTFESKEHTPKEEVSMFMPLESVQAQIQEEKKVLEASQIQNEVQEQPHENERDLTYLFSDNGQTKASLEVSKHIEEELPSPPAFETPSFESTADVSIPTEGSGDVAILKNYLSMREQDLAILKTQVQHYRSELRKLHEKEKKYEVERNDWVHQLNAWKEKFEMIERERVLIESKMEKELDNVMKEIRLKNDTIQILEERLRNSDFDMQKLKERVRIDIRKIRTREKELEGRLEILKRDSETLIASRENKIFELKRKIDLLEFNNDVLKESLEKEKLRLEMFRKKEEAVLQTLQRANEALASENFDGVASESNALEQDKASVEQKSNLDFDHEIKVA